MEFLIFPYRCPRAGRIFTSFQETYRVAAGAARPPRSQGVAFQAKTMPAPALISRSRQISAAVEGAWRQRATVYTWPVRGRRAGVSPRQRARYILRVHGSSRFIITWPRAIHIERRELGRFSLVYNQFRVTSRGGVNVVGCAAGCGRLSVEDPRRIHGARVQNRPS